MKSTEEPAVEQTEGTAAPPEPRARRRILTYLIPAVLAVVVVFGAGILLGRSVDAPAAAPAPSASVDPRFTAAMVFVACMREKGVNYPDAQANGELLISTQNGIDISSKQYQDAEKACKQYLPDSLSQGQGQGDGQGQGQGGPSQPAAAPSAPFEVSELDKYVDCIRGKGVTQFPDPDSQGNFRDVDPDWPGLQDAQAACAKYLPPGAPGAPK